MTKQVVQELVDIYGDWFKKGEDNCVMGTGRMTSNLAPYSAIFKPIQINGVSIKNRIVMAPMGNIDMCDETGRPNQKMLDYFFERAKGGTGLLTTGLIPISQGIDPSVTEKEGLTYFPRIDSSRTNLAGWRDLAQGVHSYGSKIFIQLTAGLGRVGNPECLITKHKPPVSASLNSNFYISKIPCIPLTDRAIGKLVKRFGQGAADAKTSGIDGVYLHGHEGYLMDQLTNPAFNHRNLGKYKDWQRFGIDIVKEIRARVGDKYPIMYRIDLSLALEETYGKDNMQKTSLKNFTGGRTLEQSLDYMANLVKAGVDIFDVDLGCYDNWWLPHPPAGMPAGCYIPLAKLTKDYFEKLELKTNQGQDIAVVAVGKLGYPDIAEQVLKDGQCDMVMLGRPLLCDPHWTNKVYQNKVDSITPCIGCQEGCINEFVEGGHPQCAVNARTGFEDVFFADLSPAKHKKRIGIVGAGPAGVNLAVLLAKRGHSVVLYEKADCIGGRIVPGCVPMVKFDIKNYLDYMQHGLDEAIKSSDLTVQYQTEVDANSLKNQGFDVIAVCGGTREVEPKFDGNNDIPSVQATQLLVQPELANEAQKIVVIGGGAVGLETAYWLNYELDKSVTVVDMLPHFMYGACTANRGHLIHYAKRGGIRLINCAKVTRIDSGVVHILRDVSKHVPDPYNAWTPILPENIHNPFEKEIGEEFSKLQLKADLVVFALGGRADSSLFYQLQQQKIAPELYHIGDSFMPGRVLEANRTAYRLGIRI